LLGVLLLVGEKTRGLTGWFKIGEFAFGPAEAVKIVIALLLAKYFSLRHIEMYRFSHLAASLVYVGIPCMLILLQPDLGTAVIVVTLWLAILFFAGISKQQLAILFLSGALVFTVGWTYALKEYQKERVISFLNPYNDPQGSGYNAIQAMIAVGDGGLFGKGLGYGSQIQLGFLPEAHTDFMFASIAGLVGVALVFFLLALLIWRIMSIAFHADNNFARLFCVGVVFLIFIQVVINMGMNIGLMPVIGIAFPFLSYGGSSVISFFLGLGLVQSIKARS
ncbi:rod shape-determining protein RodA, partial [Candidatus Azambacteria bacterium]|nr:rod shape-determining protein RodA [Candidatus Azambacteria bacterium]